MPTFLRTLEPGSEFKSDPQGLPEDGLLMKLIHVNQSRAYVQIVNMSAKQIKNSSGENLAEFDAPGKKISISPETLVLLVRTPFDIEMDSMNPKVKENNEVSERKPRGTGKDPIQPKKELNATKKIGKVAAFLQQKPRKIDEISKEFDITRGCAQSYLFILNRDYGFGYKVDNDVATIAPPLGGVKMKAAKDEEDYL